MNRRKFLTGLASLVVPIPKVVKLPMSSMYGVRAIDYVSAYPYNIGRGAGSTAMRMSRVYGCDRFINDGLETTLFDIKSTR